MDKMCQNFAATTAIRLLQITRCHVIHDRVAANIGTNIFIIANKISPFANDDSQFTFKINSLRLLRNAIASPCASNEDGAFRKSNGSFGTSLPSSAA